jgi:L-fuculose-phosphate aldolase
MLGHLTPNDIVCVDWNPSEKDAQASVELPVHRAIYHSLAHEALLAGRPFAPQAIVHAHTLHTTAHSLTAQKIVPLDAEGIYALGLEVAVLTPNQVIASEEAAAQLAELVKNGTRIAVLRGHGPFAVGDKLEDAYQLVSVLEHSAHIAHLVEDRLR